MTGYEASMLHSTHAAKPIHRIGLHRSGALQLQYFLQELCKKIGQNIWKQRSIVGPMDWINLISMLLGIEMRD